MKRRKEVVNFMYFYHGKDFPHPSDTKVPGKAERIHLTRVIITFDAPGDSQFSLVSIRVNTVKIPGKSSTLSLLGCICGSILKTEICMFFFPRDVKLPCCG